jgi:hypothetical protein
MESLAHATPDELERIYREAPLGPDPRGLFHGKVLAILPSLRRRPMVRAADFLLFQAPRFGIDFDRQLWWFVTPRIAMGRFEATRGRSRWRDCETVRLAYHVSRLPGPVRGLLYDEVRPLDADRCLGLGGTNEETGRGDHFFFELTRIR